MPLTPATVDDLGLQGSLSLWALLVAQDRRLPIAPTRRLALAALETLRSQGVIAVPWPQAVWDANPAARVTPIEAFQWELTWPVYPPAQLLQALEDYLEAVDRGEMAMGARLRLWTDLVAAEAESFLEQQLTKHRLPREWAADMPFVQREHSLTLAQWRYCAWAAVRRGASCAQQVGGLDGVREIAYAELRHRARRVANGAWGDCALPPYHATPASAYARGFLRLLAPLGLRYWTLLPNAESLSEMRRPDAST